MTIWLNTNISISEIEGERKYFNDQQVAIILSQPRRLITQLKTQLFTSYGCAFHALDSKHGKETVNQLWGETIFECMERYGGFLRGKNVTVGDFPEAELDLEDTDEEEDEL